MYQRAALAGNADPAPARRRRRRLSIALAAAALVAVAAGVGLELFIRSTHPPAPGAFYVPPSPLPAAPAGTIVRSERLAHPPAGATGYRILYLSRGYSGRRAALSGLLFVPSEPAPAGGRDVVVFTHGTLGVASRCALSTARSGYERYVDGLAALLRAGYVVAAPDSEGLGTPGPHPYLVGGAEADAALDAVRAAHRFAPARAGTRFVAWGASQGGQAALFTGQDAATYAPELRLAGVAVAAPATDLRALLESTRNGTFGRVLSAYALASWTRIHPHVRLGDVVTRAAQPVVRRIARSASRRTARSPSPPSASR